jgi:hypothetical protein
MNDKPDGKRLARVALLTLRLIVLVCVSVVVSVITIDVFVYRDVPTEAEIGVCLEWGPLIGLVFGSIIHFGLLRIAKPGR